MKIQWNDDLKIKEFIKLVEEEKIFLPEFQRPFVWEKSQIRVSNFFEIPGWGVRRALNMQCPTRAYIKEKSFILTK
jgi:uncharacterized protein with ParB-like and HNH nuclease domain